MSTPTRFTNQSKLERIRWLASIALVFTVFVASPLQARPETALDDYVNEPDANYSFTVEASEVGPGYTFHLLFMTSQEWRTLDEVDRTVWSHWMGVIVPDEVATDTGMLIILGGDNDGAPSFDEEELAIAANLAVVSSSVVALLGQVPNQPLFFADEPFAHEEDALVAYTWDKAMDTGDYTWPAYLPMVKSAVRAMDTVQAYVPAVSNHSVNQFVVTGFSKRGATAWLTAAVDPRVRAIAPGVIDFLNMTPHIEHHFAAYGFYSSAIEDYVNYDIVRRARTPEGQALLQVVDPYSYLDRLDMPKFLFNSSGDEFFLPDSARFYFDDLLGDNHIRYVPNTDHSLDDPSGSVENAVTSVLGWYLTILYDVPRPNISWTQQDDQLTVMTDQPPLAARLWQATNTMARDFRRETIGASWTNTPLAPAGLGTYVANVPPPAEGWNAYFIELIYPGPGEVPQTYSTQVYITPDTLPFELFDPLLDPRGLGFWKHQVAVALGAWGRAQVPAHVLEDYLPIPVFNVYVTDLEDAEKVFTARGRDVDARALKHCLALRLNVADAQLGWYTRLSLDGSAEGFLWEYWNEAHNAFLTGEPQTAKAICEAINGL